MKENGATVVIAIRTMLIIRHIAVSVTNSLPELYHKSKTRFRNFSGINMKYLIIIAFFFCSISLLAQNTEEFTKGNISYVSSQHAYVQFVNTEGIHTGDTLYVLQHDMYVPALIVNNLSSISCVCNQLAPTLLSVSTQIYARRKIENESIDVIAQKSKEAIAANDLTLKSTEITANNKGQRASTDGSLSISSYTSAGTNYSTDQRFRYNLSLNLNHINDSKLSLASYISFTHKTGDSIRLQDALKIYNLSLRYDLSKTSSLTFGRKINPNMANIGAVDGLQYEQQFNNFTAGAIVGSRPDSVYGFSPTLLQYGAFISHTIQGINGNMQTSLAFFNQMTKFQTGRRFLYFQHSNSLLKNLYLFCSFEVDLYNAKDSTNSIDLTSAYVSLRYRPLKNLSLSLSYDARKNIYYYETYKSKRDSLLENETRQGYRFQFNYRPFRKLTWGGTAGYRLQTPSTSASENGYTYLSYSQVPLINTSATIFATINKSNNMDGTDYGITLSRDIIDGKVYADLEYRKENYNLSNYATNTQNNLSLVSLIDNTMDLSLSWRITKKLILSAYFEGSVDADKNYMGRAFINISYRF
jgi:hypothetical protein